MAAARNKVRISAGEWRGRILRFPDAEGLRPTPERVRQTLFNWLGQELHGRHCLDLFAGSGALGFEAASRHAASVVLVEENRSVSRALSDNMAMLNARQMQLYSMNALQFLTQNTQRYDIVFLDPPFGQGWLPKLLPLLPEHLAEDGVVYAEGEVALRDGDGWRVIKSGKASAVRYHLLKYAS
ncbi:MAG: 16S rRNA (guanine(966)-N(2))-methyltransferase RsmD [Methylobacillus sp.]|nr:16S rRNA (guanine(966)-N(2))-methyltransferase RsmD [Methylobacillus sp.]